MFRKLDGDRLQLVITRLRIIASTVPGDGGSNPGVRIAAFRDRYYRSSNPAATWFHAGA
jgi:hypothetical protein